MTAKCLASLPQMQQQPLRLLKEALPHIAELCQCCTIHNPVICTPADRHDGHLLDGSIRPIARQELYTPKGNNGRFRDIHKWGGIRAAQGSDVGDRQRAATHVQRRQPPRSRHGLQARQLAGDLNNRSFVDPLDVRHNQTNRSGHGHPKVVMGMLL